MRSALRQVRNVILVENSEEKAHISLLTELEEAFSVPVYKHLTPNGAKRAQSPITGTKVRSSRDQHENRLFVYKLKVPIFPDLI